MKESQLSTGQQIERVIDNIRRGVGDDSICISVEYIEGLFGPAVGIAAIAYLQEKNEIVKVEGSQTGPFLKAREQ